MIIITVFSIKVHWQLRLQSILHIANCILSK